MKVREMLDHLLAADPDMDLGIAYIDPDSPANQDKDDDLELTYVEPAAAPLIVDDDLVFPGRIW